MKTIFLAIVKLFSPTVNYGVGWGEYDSETGDTKIEVDSGHSYLGDAQADIGLRSLVTRRNYPVRCFNHLGQEIKSGELPISPEDIIKYNKDVDDYDLNL